jgi:hypothetical protein
VKLDEIYSGLETAGLTDVIAGIKNHISGLNSESAGHRKRAEDYASERDSFKNQFETVKNGGSLEMLTLKTRLETLEKTVTEQDKLLIETQVKTTLKEKLTPLFDSASDLLALTATRDNLAVIDDLGKISLKFGDKVFDIDDINGLKMLGSRYGVSEMATVSKGKPAPVNGNGNADIDKFKAMNQTELMKYAKQGATQENEVLSFMQQNK